MACFLLLFYFASLNIFSQQAGLFPRILSKPNQACDNEVKVVDLYTSNCNYESNCNFLYPVLIEDFDNNFDLPNKWAFDYGYTKDDNGNKTAWHGDAYVSSVFGPNHNIQLNNGIATFLNIEENVTRVNNGNSYDFNFTSGMVASLSKFRTGVFEARIKIPSANKMWPAFWLLSNKSNYSEVDIFEFYDNNVGSNPGQNSNCDTYDLHKMTIHGGATGNDCHRGDKYPLNNLNDFHDYKLVWNDHETFIYVDGLFRGYATRYFKNSTIFPVIPCLYSYGNGLDPALSYNCNQIQYLSDNLLPTIPYINWGSRPWWLPNAISWPPPQPPQPYLANKLRQDSYFPEKDNSMSLIINNNINKKYVNDGFSNFSQSSLNMEVDWIKVYQPFCCGMDKVVCNLADLDNQTYFSDFLTGRKLNIGFTNNSCTFIQNKPGNYINGAQDFRDIPVIFLATDEIAIQGDAFFPGDTYAEMRITDCGSNARMNNSEIKQVEDFYQSQQVLMDSIVKIDFLNSDSIAKSEYENTMQKYKEMYYIEDGENINIGPTPALDYIDILCSNTVYEKIVSLSLIDMNGKISTMSIQHTINIEYLKSGFYELKIGFNDGSIVLKKVVKM